MFFEIDMTVTRLSHTMREEGTKLMKNEGIARFTTREKAHEHLEKVLIAMEVPTAV